MIITPVIDVFIIFILIYITIQILFAAKYTYHSETQNGKLTDITHIIIYLPIQA